MMPAVSDTQDHSDPILGIAFKLASVLSLSAMAACVKQIGASLPVAQIVFFRGSIAIVVLAFIAWHREGLRLLATRNWRGHGARSLAGSLSMFCWFSALALIPLAQMTAISFTIPLFLTVLAMAFLGERIHAYRWTALVIGFAGVLIIVAPELRAGTGNALGIGLSLLAAVLAAFALLSLRRISGHEHALTITFYFFVTSTTLALLTLPFGGWPMPDRSQWLFLGMTGLFGVVGQLLMSYSYRYAEASLVAPLDYVNMLISIAIGYYFFAEIPNFSTWIGAPLVIASGGIILWREYVRRRHVRAVRPIDQ